MSDRPQRYPFLPYLVRVPAAGGRTWTIGSYNTEAEAVAAGVAYATENRTNCGSATVHHTPTGRCLQINQRGEIEVIR